MTPERLAFLQSELEFVPGSAADWSRLGIEAGAETKGENLTEMVTGWQGPGEVSTRIGRNWKKNINKICYETVDFMIINFIEKYLLQVGRVHGQRDIV